MLYQAVLYLTITILCLWAGLVFFSIFRWIDPDFPPYHRPLISYLLSGLVLFTIIGQWVVLCRPLNPVTFLTYIIPVLLILSLLLRRHMTAIFRQLGTPLRRHPFFLPCLAVFTLMILVLNAGPTVMDDTDSYHIQIIKWIQEYGTVPGIANLHIRYGVNSSWFEAIALLTPSLKGVNHYLTLNGLLSCWLCHYLLQKIFTTPAGPFNSLNLSQLSNPSTPPGPDSQRLAAFIVLLLALLAWPMIRGNAATANYDFISTCCILVLVFEASAVHAPTRLPEWMVWPFFLCTIKLINIPFLLISLLSLLLYNNKPRRKARLLYPRIAALLLMPFFIRNITTTGYPLFPLPLFGPTQNDFAAPWSLVKEWMDYTLWFNRSGGNPELVQNLGFLQWFPTWITHMVWYDMILTILSFLAWLMILIRWKQIVKNLPASYWIIILTLFLTLLSWFFSAPDPRFIYGVLMAGIIIYIMNIKKLPNPGRINIAAITLSIGIFIYTIARVAGNSDSRNWTWPHQLPVPDTKEITIDGIRMQIPEKVLKNWNPRCYDLQLPCLYNPNPYLHARGKSISDGFKTMNDDQPMTGEFKIN